MKFEFATAGRIVFGRGRLAEAGSLASALGRRAFLLTGRGRTRAAGLIDRLKEAAILLEIETVGGEPDFDFVRAATARARDFGADLVIAFGGGSVIDAAKAIAALLANPGDPLDYAEVVGGGRALAQASLPCIAIPTTSGTGSEVTRNAVLTARREAVKVSLRSPWMLPRIALVDPELCLGLPAALTASTGLDALTQLIEPFVSNAHNPLVDGLCREGMKRTLRSLPIAFERGTDSSAREDMALASLFGGLALANAGLGAVHGLAGPLGGAIGAAHGSICSALLPGVVSANVSALRRSAPDSPALGRYAEIAGLLSGRPSRAEDAGPALRLFVQPFDLPGLAKLGLAAKDIGTIAERALRSSSMRANPITLSVEELSAILEGAM